jgi:hypothetical protein
MQQAPPPPTLGRQSIGAEHVLLVPLGQGAVSHAVVRVALEKQQ